MVILVLPQLHKKLFSILDPSFLFENKELRLLKKFVSKLFTFTSIVLFPLYLSKC